MIFMARKFNKELTNFQLELITTLAVDAWDAQNSGGPYEYINAKCQAIYMILVALQESDVFCAEGLQIVNCNGKEKPPTKEAIKQLLPTLLAPLPLHP
jgi:hypothetical protein